MGRIVVTLTDSAGVPLSPARRNIMYGLTSAYPSTDTNPDPDPDPPSDEVWADGDDILVDGDDAAVD